MTLSSTFVISPLAIRNARSLPRALSITPRARSLFTQPQKTVSVRRTGPRPDDQGTTNGKKDTLWQSWLNLRPSVRLVYGITVAGK